MRYFIVIAAIMATLACVWIATDAWLDAVSAGCTKFKDLSAECYAPHVMASVVVWGGVILSQIVLGWLAIKSRTKSEN